MFPAIEITPTCCSWQINLDTFLLWQQYQLFECLPMPQIKVIAFWASIAATFLLLSNTQAFAQESNLYRVDSDFYHDSLFTNMFHSVNDAARPLSWKENGTYLLSFGFSEASTLASFDFLQLEGSPNDAIALEKGFQVLLGKKSNANFSPEKKYLIPVITTFLKDGDAAISLSPFTRLNAAIAFALKICGDCQILPVYELYRVPVKSH